MKHEMNNQISAKSKSQINYGKALARVQEKPICSKPMINRQNTFLVQNIGKDPPGRPRIAGAICCLDPDYITEALTGDKTIFIINIQAFKQIQNLNFFNN
jgi:hypothetical protein